MGNNIFPTPPPPTTKYFPSVVAKIPSLQGKIIAITGCTSGTGLCLAKTCSEKGAKVIMINRPSKRADAALAEVPNAILIPCDLQSFASVKTAGEELKQKFHETGINVICLNAGVMGLPDEATADGCDIQMQSNHLSHFLLISCIWSLLETSVRLTGEARIVSHSSGARLFEKRVEAQYYRRDMGGKLGGDGFPGLGKWHRYSQTKLANLMYTYALKEHIKKERPEMAGKIKCFCAHPGPANSGLQGKTATAGGTRILDQYVIWSTLKRAQTTEDGTLGILRACCDEQVVDGGFYGPTQENKGVGLAELLPEERNPEGEEVCWQESLKTTGIDKYFG
jgi:NAD(P)-dependent dehydrogenase (short-subunit alcohol dehydrogenase family)